MENILTDGTGKVVIIGYNEVESASMRETGYRDYMAENAPGVEVLESQTFSGDQMKAATVMQDFLTKYDEIDAVFGVGDMAVLGAITSATAAGRAGGDAHLVAGDLVDKAVFVGDAS